MHLQAREPLSTQITKMVTAVCSAEPPAGWRLIPPPARSTDSWPLSAESSESTAYSLCPLTRGHTWNHLFQKAFLKKYVLLHAGWGSVLRAPPALAYFITALCLAHKWHLAIKNYLVNVTCHNIFKLSIEVSINDLPVWAVRSLKLGTYFIYSLMSSSWHHLTDQCCVNTYWINKHSTFCRSKDK